MKKNILFLINGFGIESASSYNVYSNTLMPNLDKLTRTSLFGTLSNKNYDYLTGYRTLSVGTEEPLTSTLVERTLENNGFNTNKSLSSIFDYLEENNIKLHIFFYYENDKSIDQLLLFLRDISERNIKILVHVILMGKWMSRYANIEKNLNKLNYEYDNIKIGIITGINNLSNTESAKEIVKALTTSLGEKWKDIGKRINVFIKNKTRPDDARTFVVGDNFKLENNTYMLFFNYSKSNITTFINELNNQKYSTLLDIKTVKSLSLFPLVSTPQIPHLFNYPISSKYMINSLKELNAKCVIYDNKEKCSYINYFMSGLRNIVDSSVEYMASDNDFLYNVENVKKIIKTSNKDLIILNYEIDSCKNIKELETRLNSIDTIIGGITSTIIENNYTLYISSLYGLEKDLINDKLEMCSIDFSLKVPLIIVDKLYKSNSYSLRDGNIYDLANTIYKNINDKYKVHSLIKKKASFLSMLYKK